MNQPNTAVNNTRGPSDLPSGGPPSSPRPPVALACLEIFGGNDAADTVVAVPGLDVWLYAQPFGGDRGGDIHYVTACGSGNIARILLADVAGHGPQADALARDLRDAVRRSIETVDMRRIARALNDAFTQWETRGRFATALVATYYAPADRLALLNAGHPRPMLYDARADRWRAVDADDAHSLRAARNLPLGVIEGADFEQVAFEFTPGDALLLVTDAVLERQDDRGSPLDEGGLLDLLNAIRDTPLDRLVARLVSTLRARSPAPFNDDLSIVLARRTDQGVRRLSAGEIARVWMRRLGLAAETASMVSDDHLRDLAAQQRGRSP